MANIDLKLLRVLRDETAASVADCRMALEESGGNYEKALAWLKKRSIERAERKADRVTMQGIVDAYIHQGEKVGVLVEILCETDFVAKTDEFRHLAKEIGMQVAAMNPKDVDSLMRQEYIRDGSQTIEKFDKSVVGKLGENIVIKRFVRFEI